MSLVYVINIAQTSGSSLSPDSWALTCADVPVADHQRLQDRGSHNGASGPPGVGIGTPAIALTCWFAACRVYRSDSPIWSIPGVLTPGLRARHQGWYAVFSRALKLCLR